MLSRSNVVAWINDTTADQDDTVSWLRPPPPPPPQPPLDGGDWFMPPHHHQQLYPDLQLNAADIGMRDESLILHQTASHLPLLPFSAPPRPSLSSFLNSFGTTNNNSNPFDPGFNFGPDVAFSGPGHEVVGPTFEMPGGGGGGGGGGYGLLAGLEGFEGAVSPNPNSMLFAARPKMLRPLEGVGPGQGQGQGLPTLFQKRAMTRSSGSDGGWGKKRRRREHERDEDEEGDEEEGSFGVSMVNYEDSDEFNDEGNGNYNHCNNNNDKFDGNNVGNCDGNFSNSNANSIVTGGGGNGGGGGDQKGKRKGLPAKNLMAERRRRKKLNDRLYMLRSVVPKISKVSFW